MLVDQFFGFGKQGTWLTTVLQDGNDEGLVQPVMAVKLILLLSHVLFRCCCCGPVTCVPYTVLIVGKHGVRVLPAVYLIYLHVR